MSSFKWREKDLRFGGLFCVIPFLLFLSCNKPDATAQATPIPKMEVTTLDTPALVQIQVPDTIVPRQVRRFRIVGVGDMMLGTNYPSPNYLPAHGGARLLEEVSSIIQAADVSFGNLEGTILDKGGTAKRCSDPSKCYAFRSPESYAKHFADAGFDFLSLANNHSGDFGPIGRARTKAVLDELDIAYAGLRGSDEQAVIERDGIRYGMAAFAPNSGTVDVRQIGRAKTIVADLATKCDIVIVSFHGGAEGASHQHVPRKTETYYGENRGNVYYFAHAVIDAGADIVFGHGPHVTRAMELYNDRLICYSLGNFCTYGRFSLRGPAGVAPLVEVEVDEEGKFLGGKVTPIYQAKTHGPKIDPQKRAIRILQDLTKADFPETNLVIEADGTLRKR